MSRRLSPFPRLPRRRLLALMAVVALGTAGCGGPSPDHARVSAGSDSVAATSRPGAPAAVSELGRLVDSVLEAYGGRDALEAVEAYRCEGRVEAGSEPGETVRWFEYPDRLRIEMRYRNWGDLRIVRGDQGWTGPDDRNLVPLGNEFYRSTYLQMARMSLPLRLVESEADLVELAPDAAGRRVLHLSLAENLSLDCHIDIKTRRIEAVTLNMLDPEPAVVTVELSEFRWVDGVLFPFREDAYSGETKTATVRFRSVEVNPITPVLLFAPEGDF
jgi:hypothetical protein